MANEYCKNCKFSNFINEDKVYEGYCRRYPPAYKGAYDAWAFPKVGQYETCGEYKLRENDEQKK